MTTTDEPAPLFAFDERYDRDLASDGHSRYGAYLRQGLAMLEDGDWSLRDPVGWATFCWDRATIPVMCPPYLWWPDPIETVMLTRGHAGGLVAEVVVKVRPARLPCGWRTWDVSSAGLMDSPDDDRHAIALGRVSLIVPVPAGALPDPPGKDAPAGAELELAKASVSCLARLLTDAITPVLPTITGNVEARR